MAATTNKRKKSKRKPPLSKKKLREMIARGPKSKQTMARALAARKKLELAIEQVDKCISELVQDFYYGM